MAASLADNDDNSCDKAVYKSKCDASHFFFQFLRN